MPEPDSLSKESEQDQLQEDYLKALDKVEEGSLVKGSVVQIDDEFVFLDVGLKSDGKLLLEEFDTIPELGQVVGVILVKQEDRNGNIVISKRRADTKIIWKTLKSSLENHKAIECKVIETVKGGFKVNINGHINGFCPSSKMDVMRIDNPESLAGQKFFFHIDRLFGDKKVNIVLNRKQYLEEQTEINRKQFFETVSIGDEVLGTVKAFTSFGAFIDIGGFDGLIHMNDMSWGHVNRPKDYLKKNQEIKFKVIRMDPETKKINLSIKHFQPDPWSEFENKYHVDQIINGKITKITDFGAFIEIEEGIEGLVHISELSWVKRIQHPKELLSIGDECEAMILGYDIPQGRISLGIKQVLPNPWDEIGDKYPVGMKGTWKVKKITNAGAFVEIEAGIEGFIHCNDLSWTKKIRTVTQVLQVGEEFEGIIISSNSEERRIRIGIKQLVSDPWVQLAKKNKRGSIIEGVISGKTDFGIFVKVEGDIEGLIHKTNLVSSRDEDPEAKLQQMNIGDSIRSAVVEVNSEKQKLSLSLRELQYREEQAEISKYMESDDSSFTLADIVNDKDE